MSFNQRLWPIACAAILVVAITVFCPITIKAQAPELIIDVGDTNAVSGEQSVRIPVYLSNLVDTIAGFDLWVQMDRPDIAEFAMTTATDIDTNYWCCITWDGPDCVDSQLCSSEDNWDWITVDTTVHQAGIIDTVGTLIGGWEFMSARSLGGTGSDMSMSAVADLAFDPGVTPGIAPQEGGVLFYYVLNAFDIPDTMTERTVSLLVVQNLSNICFSDPAGNCVGYELQEVVDSNCYVCVSWAGDLCLEWQQTVWPSGGVGCDSIGVEYDTVPYLNTNQVLIYNGSLAIDEPYGTYGDFNNDGSTTDISDLVYLVSYMFAGGPPPDPLWSADCDYDGDIDIADLVCWVTWMFPPQ